MPTPRHRTVARMRSPLPRRCQRAAQVSCLSWRRSWGQIPQTMMLLPMLNCRPRAPILQRKRRQRRLHCPQQEHQCHRKQHRQHAHHRTQQQLQQHQQQQNSTQTPDSQRYHLVRSRRLAPCRPAVARSPATTCWRYWRSCVASASSTLPRLMLESGGAWPQFRIHCASGQDMGQVSLLTLPGCYERAILHVVKISVYKTHLHHQINACRFWERIAGLQRQRRAARPRQGAAGGAHRLHLQVGMAFGFRVWLFTSGRHPAAVHAAAHVAVSFSFPFPFNSTGHQDANELLVQPAGKVSSSAPTSWTSLAMR